jgi:mono/diheme cytochrome c family protein
LRQTHLLRMLVRSVGMAAVLTAASSLSLAADVARGRALYENHCGFCHTPKIHSRANKLPMTKNEVRLMVDDWRRQSNLAWTPEEVEDVVEYLNATRYRFAPD